MRNSVGVVRGWRLAHVHGHDEPMNAASLVKQVIGYIALELIEDIDEPIHGDITARHVLSHMSKRADELNTTSFSMLGMLAIRPWSTYELAKHMDRSLRPLWPRARSHLFNEPKKLVVHGLAAAVEESVGRRPRTVYSITPKGRRALRRWLGTPGEGPVLEFEQLLKMFFADHGTKTDALDAVARIKSWARERNAENIAVARSYVDGTGPFPERASVLTVVGRFHVDFADMVNVWADWAATTIEGWPDEPRKAKPDWTFMKRLARRNPGRY